MKMQKVLSAPASELKKQLVIKMKFAAVDLILK